MADPTLHLQESDGASENNLLLKWFGIEDPPTISRELRARWLGWAAHLDDPLPCPSHRHPQTPTTTSPSILARTKTPTPHLYAEVILGGAPLLRYLTHSLRDTHLIWTHCLLRQTAVTCLPQVIR